MRIWFGLILKIMVRTKSYILPELCYLTKSIGKCAKLQFFSRSIPSCLFLLPSKTCLYFLIISNAIIEGMSSLHDFFGRYIMEFEKIPEIRSINYMKKSQI